MADAIFALGEAFAALGRAETAERRMLEGISHWEELVGLEESAGLKVTCSHLEAEVPAALLRATVLCICYADSSTTICCQCTYLQGRVCYWHMRPS